MQIILFLTNYHFDKLSNWYKSLRNKHPFIRIPTTAVCLVFILLLLGPIVSLFTFYMYWVPGIMIPISWIVFFILAIRAFKSKGVQRHILWKKATKCFSVPAFFWIAVLSFSIACWFGSTWGEIRMVSSRPRFPLAHIQGIAVDSKGQVYCLSRMYNRIQVFNNRGEFLRGWFIDLPGGDHRILVDEQNHLLVASENKGTCSFFNANGELIREVQISNFNEFGEDSWIKTKDAFGNIYEVRSYFLWPKVVKITPLGEKSVLIKDPFGLWVITMMLPFFWFALGMGIICFIGPRRLEKNKYRQ